MISKLIPEDSTSKQLLKRWAFDPRIPRHIQGRFIYLNDCQLITIKDSLQDNFFSRESSAYLSSNVGQRDLQDHLLRRLEENRKYTIPWLDSVKPLQGAKILEIGCGTGCSTVALAEQGAKVVAVDIDDLALKDAKNRCQIYDLKVEFVKSNATDLSYSLPAEQFDFVIFWASLEHMTIDERLSAMKTTWQLIPRGGLWCVTDTPNRLWFYDFHTSSLPFFMWLPDSLAIKYSSFSSRQKLREAFVIQDNIDAELQFCRWGRGVSFHEFALSIGAAEHLNILSCMAIFNRRQRVCAQLKWAFSDQRRYESLLRHLCPSIHRGFFQPNLDLILQKV